VSGPMRCLPSVAWGPILEAVKIYLKNKLWFLARRETLKKRRVHAVEEHFKPVRNSPKKAKTGEECRAGGQRRQGHLAFLGIGFNEFRREINDE